MRKNLVIILFGVFTLLIVFTPTAQSCSYEKSNNKEVNEGEIAYYFIRVTNYNQPLGVDVRVDLTQNVSNFVVQNSEFHLDHGDYDFVHIYVDTTVEEIDYIVTNFTAYEKEAYESEYQQIHSSYFKTTIIHPSPPPPPDPDDDRSNIFLGVLGPPIAIIILYLIFRWRIGSLVFVPQYSLLKKDEIFQNSNRKAIFQALADSEHGLTTKNVQNTTGINIGTVRYHLKTLEDHGYIAKTDKMYYLRPGGARKTFFQQILVAQENGATTIREVAKVLDTSTHRVWYHIRKNGSKVPR